METQKSSELIVSKNDHALLMNYLRTNTPELEYDRTRTVQLIEEFGKARVINNTDFPSDVVRLNSNVVIRNTLARQNYKYTIVLPGNVDFRSEKVSVLGTIGFSLLGSRKGDTITIASPKGKRHFTILEVTNPVD
jgi:regulator of nucleoside diphosphate kinase